VTTATQHTAVKPS